MSDLTPVWKTREYKNSKQREWRERNPAKSVAYVMAAYAKRRSTPEGWLSYVLANAKRRAIRAGLVSDISAADIALPLTCCVLRTVLVYGAAKNDPASPSLDRINPALGYVSGNVRVISLLANLLKSNCTNPAVFLALAADAERLLNGRR